MTDRERCERCDRPQPAEAECEAMAWDERNALCHRNWSDICGHPAVNWRARAKAALAERSTFLPEFNGLHADDESADNCPTFYDGCHCTIETLRENIDRAETWRRACDAAASLCERVRVRKWSPAECATQIRNCVAPNYEPIPEDPEAK